VYRDTRTPQGNAAIRFAVYRQGTTDFRTSNSPFSAKFFSISPGYLGAAETQLLSGRDFSWHDDAKAPRVVIVNENFARWMFGTVSALGRRLTMADKDYL